MWLIINIVILVIGAGIFLYALKIDSSENTEALFYGMVGVVVVALAGLSQAASFMHAWLS